jgi:hypothetical protein
MGIVDGKNIVYSFLKNEFDKLKQSYPDKINVNITTESPQLEKLIKTDKTLAYILISRLQNELEFNLISDLFQNTNTYIGQYEERTGGNLQVDFYEIEIQSASPQYRDDLYNLIRYLFLFNRKTMLAQYPGLRNIRRTTGRDLPTEAMGEQPTMIYKASLTYLVQTDLVYKTTEELVEAIDVDEISLDIGF